MDRSRRCLAGKSAISLSAIWPQSAANRGRNPAALGVCGAYATEASRGEKQGLAPSPEADKVTLIRRLSLDLIGLPPAIEEVDQFTGDGGPDAYGKLVDRLLDNPH